MKSTTAKAPTEKQAGINVANANPRDLQRYLAARNRTDLLCPVCHKDPRPIWRIHDLSDRISYQDCWWECECDLLNKTPSLDRSLPVCIDAMRETAERTLAKLTMRGRYNLGDLYIRVTHNPDWP